MFAHPGLSLGHKSSHKTMVASFLSWLAEVRSDCVSEIYKEDSLIIDHFHLSAQVTISVLKYPSSKRSKIQLKSLLTYLVKLNGCFPHPVWLNLSLADLDKNCGTRSAFQSTNYVVVHKLCNILITAVPNVKF